MYQLALGNPPQVIHMLTPEARGLLGTGGLQHAVLDKAKFMQSELGHKVSLVMPYFKSFENLALNPKVLVDGLTVSFDGGRARFNYDIVQFAHPEIPNLDIIGIRHMPGAGYSNIFDNIVEGATIYSKHHHDGQTFAFFGKAYTNWIDNIAFKIQPDVVVLNDWHTGVTGAFLSERKTRILNQKSNRKFKLPLVQGVIHNLRYQGNFDSSLYAWLDIDPKIHGSMELNGRINFLKVLMEHSDYVEAVSAQYAKEGTTRRFGEGLEGVVRRLTEEGRFGGLLNGIDPKVWDSRNLNIKDGNYDSLSFDIDNLDNKQVGKERLIREFFGEGADVNSNLIALTARIDDQKGYSYLLGESGLLKKLLEADELNIKIVLTGDPHGDRAHSSIVKELETLQKNFPSKISVNRFSSILERKFLYFSDFYFGGSIFEPSGLAQMFSQSVGTVPIVSRVGGHVDSVLEEVTGFLFDIALTDDGHYIHNDNTTRNALEALKKAINLKKNSPDTFNSIIKNTMALDNSWSKRVEVFEKFIDLADIGILKGYNGQPNQFGSENPFDIEAVHRELELKGAFCQRAFKPFAGLR